MSNEASKNPKSYRTAGILFSIGGLIFIMVTVISGKVGVFLAPGIAFFIIGIALWQHSKKLTDEVGKEED